jgi:hypothetical protein
MPLTVGDMAGLARPTPRQCAAFVDQVCWAHSWYKHLDLVAGGRFVVFLAPDAGGGFDSERPRLHHGWKTTADYRARFGHLDFMWQLAPDEPWRRDGGADQIALPDEVWQACSFALYPYCSNDDNAIEVLAWRIREEMTDEPPGSLQALVDANERAEAAYQALAEPDRELVLAGPRDGGPLPTPVRDYLALEDGRDALYAALRAPEVTKLERALDRLLQLVER